MKPIIYLYFHSKILAWKGKEMTEKDFKSCLFQWRIPKTLRYLIMKEMKQMGLLEISRGKVYMNDYYFDEDKLKRQVNFKDGDTKVESPYIPNGDL